MKLASLKIVTNEQTINRSVAAIIEDDAPSPDSRGGLLEPMPPRIVRRLDVDGVLARSLPKTLDESYRPTRNKLSREFEEQCRRRSDGGRAQCRKKQ